MHPDVRRPLDGRNGRLTAEPGGLTELQPGRTFTTTFARPATRAALERTVPAKVGSMRTPPVRFVTAPDGVRLAYAVYRNGPPLVWAAHWLTHLEYAWESPVWRHMVEFFARHFTVVRYDERGCGLSDWTDKNLALDTWVADL